MGREWDADDECLFEVIPAIIPANHGPQSTHGNRQAPRALFAVAEKADGPVESARTRSFWSFARPMSLE